jgi:DNA (cytosine-5)-methyltransferase 1
LVDLFAGCGGLSLGLENAGFRPVYVNELGTDALATYLDNRLHEFPELATSNSADIFDVTGDASTNRPNLLPKTVADLSERYGEIDLVVGGPPCQGYSGIGHRRTFTGIDKQDIPSNHLYREMAKFVAATRPRAFLFENVKGLLSSRWFADGEKGEIWEDVKAAFRGSAGYANLPEYEALREYEVHHELVYAKDYGVPQNRPRILLVGVRKDCLPRSFRPNDKLPAKGFLPKPTGAWPHPEDFLGDLVDPDYRGKAATTEYLAEPLTPAQCYFRTDSRNGHVSRAGEPLDEQEYSHHAQRIVDKFQYMIDHEGKIRPGDQTKKFAQRVIPRKWGPDGPQITATSLPDDYVHYEQPRILTVREWARLQWFPDWYKFAGKRTTGGRRRAGDPAAGDWSRELPKYTQIGNAVPVRLAEAVGEHLLGLIR